MQLARGLTWAQPYRFIIIAGIIGGLAASFGFFLTGNHGPWGACSDLPCQRAAVAAELLDAINAERARVGCTPAQVQPQLTRAARVHAEQLAAPGGFRVEVDPADWQARARAQGYLGQVEQSAAFGLPNVASVMTQWRASGSPVAPKERLHTCTWRSLGVAYQPIAAGRRFEPGVWVVFFGDR